MIARLASYWNRSVVAALLMLAGGALTLGAQHLQEDAVLDTGENGTFEFCGGREFILKVKPAFEPRIHIFCRYPSRFVMESRRQYPWMQVRGTRIIRTTVYLNPEKMIDLYSREGGTVSLVQRDDWNSRDWLDNFSQPYNQPGRLGIRYP